MDIKVYETYKPIVTFFQIGLEVYYKYNGNIEKVNYNSIMRLKEQLEIPYKVSFTGINMANIGRIIKDLRYEDTAVFWYRIRNPKSDSIKIHAIFTEKNKVKKLEK